MVFNLPSTEIVFPKPELADEDGLLAVGGDLQPERLILAYHNSIFPWYSDDEPILWFSPHERCVIYPDKLKISKSMKQVLNAKTFTVNTNKAFAEVIANCANVYRAGQPGTWITTDMQEAYLKLHELGWAHSVEVWQGDKLVGGLYGLLVNNVFCGESMFSLVSNASKTALIYLCNEIGVRLVDCQMPNSHLMSLGAEMISRETYMAILQAT